MRRKLMDLLQEGAQEYDYLKNIDYTKESTNFLLDETGRLIEYLLQEKRSSEKKYTKLLELHDKLVEINSKSQEKYNVEYIYGIADENDKLKEELQKLRVRQMYLWEV